MNYCKIDPCDIANGEGVRVSLWVSGCTHHCKGCFNQETWDFNYGQPYTEKTEQEIIKLLKRPYIAGLSILGGDPMCQSFEGISNLITLSMFVRNQLHKTVWLWTGYNFEDIQDIKFILFSQCDVVIDGSYIESLRDISLPYCGSSNQKVIDVQKTLKKGEIVLWDI